MSTTVDRYVTPSKYNILTNFFFLAEFLTCLKVKQTCKKILLCDLIIHASERELKGWLTGFFLGLIVFMGCSLTCVYASFFLKTHYFSHNLPLFHTSFCPFSDKSLDNFLVL